MPTGGVDSGSGSHPPSSRGGAAALTEPPPAGGPLRTTGLVVAFVLAGAAFVVRPVEGAAAEAAISVLAVAVGGAAAFRLAGGRAGQTVALTLGLGVVSIGLLAFVARGNTERLDAAAIRVGLAGRIHADVLRSRISLAEHAAGDASVDLEREVVAPLDRAVSDCAALRSEEPGAARDRLCRQVGELARLTDELFAQDAETFAPDDIYRFVSHRAADLAARKASATRRSFAADVSWANRMWIAAVVALALMLAALIKSAAAHRARLRAWTDAMTGSERRWLDVLRGLPVAVVVVDDVGRPYFANDAAVSLLGPGTAPGASASETYRIYEAGSDRLFPSTRMPAQQALGGSVVEVHDIEIRGPGGLVRVRAHGIPIFDLEGNVAFAAAAFVDATEEKSAIGALEQRRSSLQLLRTIAELPGTGDGTEVLRVAVEGVCTLLEWPLGHAYRLDGEWEALPVWYGAGTAGVDEFRNETMARPGTRILDRLHAERRAVWVDDVLGNPDFDHAEVAVRAGFVSSLLVPVPAGDEVIAALAFYSNDPTPPSPDMVWLAELVGMEVGRSLAVMDRVEMQTRDESYLAGLRGDEMAATKSGPSRAVRLLLVEADPADARSTEEALRDGHLWYELHHVRDGNEAIDFLRRQGAHSQAPRPDLVFLDLQLAGKSGREVLKEMKRDDSLKTIPVVVMTSSESEQDTADAYELQANAYVRKPVDLAQFVRVVKSVNHFWLTVVQLPHRDRP